MLFQNKDIQTKYENDYSFRNKVDQIEDQYFFLQAKTTKMTEDMLIDETILERFPVDNNIHLYFWYGFMQPPPNHETSKLTLNFIKLFNPQQQMYYLRPHRNFIFVYFNNHTRSSDYFFQFKNIFLLLPLSILERMKGFVLVRPSFYMKALNLFGTSLVNSFNFDTYLHFDSCRELCRKMQLDVNSFATFVPQKIAEQFPEERKQRPTLALCRQNIKGQTMSEKQKTQKIAFQLSVKSFLAKQVYTLQNFEEGELGIPKILELLISYFKMSPQGLQMEGIFRKSVSIDEENYILEQLGLRNYDYLSTIQNPYLVACLIKRFFYNLKVPLIPYDHYNRLIAVPQLENIKKVVKDLPKKNYLTLMFLMEFLKNDVITKESSNKMGSYGIAVCFSQSIMRAEVQTEEALLHSKTIVTITNTLLTNFGDIFDDGDDRKNVMAQRIQDQKMEFEKTVKLQLSLDFGHRFSAHQLSDIMSPKQIKRQFQSSAPQITVNVEKVERIDKIKKEEEKKQEKQEKQEKEEKDENEDNKKEKRSLQNTESAQKKTLKKAHPLENEVMKSRMTAPNLSGLLNLNERMSSISQELQNIESSYKQKKYSKEVGSKPSTTVSQIFMPSFLQQSTEAKDIVQQPQKQQLQKPSNDISTVNGQQNPHVEKQTEKVEAQKEKKIEDESGPSKLLGE